MKKLHILLGEALLILMGTSCQGGKTSADIECGDTLQMKYAQLLTIVKHGTEGDVNEALASKGNEVLASGMYAEVNVANPWKKGTVLHRYILIPQGKEGDATVAMLAKRRAGGVRCTTDTVRTPIESSVVFTSPHCQLMYELGAKNAIRGVCDLDYINIPDVKRRAADKAECARENAPSGKASKGELQQTIIDCGSSMAPDIEKIIALKPQALLISPFENSGGYGKLDKLHIPIIETADYMETSPLGRAEWMKFYGMLFGEEIKDEKEPKAVRPVSFETRADSLFAKIEKEYLWLKAQAKTLPKGLSVLTERKTGNVWYVPGGQSTMGVLLKDANARYIFEDDKHSGSLAMSPEQILAKGKEVDVWAFKYFEPTPLTRPQLLQEYGGYKALKPFTTKDIYECSTSSQPYFELTSFHPEVLLREFILLAHNEDKFFGKLRFYKPLVAPDNLPIASKCE